MVALERDNPSLKGVLPKEYARPGLDQVRLGQIIDLISTIGMGDTASRSKDVIGRVYEYFLSMFASAEGKKGGQFYTPRCVVALLVRMLAPYKGRVYDPACGSGGMFVQSEKFMEEHGGRLGDISVYGQESNYTTWRLAKMNLAVRGIDSNIAHGDTFHNPKHPDLKADYVLANPPFNDSDWRGDLLKEDQRWQFGVPPAGNASYAWVQHFIHHLAPMGTAGFVLANGSMSSNQSGEGEIRKNIIEAGLVDCMVAMPGQLFYSTQIPVCLWFVTRAKQGLSQAERGTSGDGTVPALPTRERRNEILFIDARNLGTLIDRVHRELNEDDLARVADTYHAWRGDPDRPKKAVYEDIPGFCKAPPIGSKPVLIRLAIPRVQCLVCGLVRQVKVSFAHVRRRYTKRLEKYVLRLLRTATIKDVAAIVGLSWDVVKDIQKRWLTRHYRLPRLKGVRHIAIDEISIGKGHRYLTVVLDLCSGKVLFVGDGKGAEALKPFWRRVSRCKQCKIDSVAIDMSPAYISAVSTKLSTARLVFDRFHIVKLCNEMLTRLRRALYREATEQLHKDVLKGTRWLLLKNPENIDATRNEGKRLQEALALNAPLAKAYYMKDELRQLWSMPDKEQAELSLKG
jgi:transposase